ncbi:unnamed protein product [Rotaria magnacalcarata]|uniref:Uncharacterized protein n=1 Tax=Rotaria magnacalcarata TaxID=392030 RepID=A0A816NJU3_9BILA|nr:unnamed protein product [Rotaria magnacalcarata]
MNEVPSVLVEQTIEYVSQIEQHNEVQNITNVDTNSIEEDLQNQPKLNFNELNEAEQKDVNDSSSLTVFYECVSDMGFIVLDWGSVNHLDDIAYMTFSIRSKRSTGFL